MDDAREVEIVDAFPNQVGSPANDFYNRPIQPRLATPAIDRLVAVAREKLGALVSHMNPKMGSFDPTNNKHVLDFMHQQKQLLSKLSKEDPLYQVIKNKVTLIEDLHKVNHLVPIFVPHELPGTQMDYYCLEESTGGVTEKITLVSLDTVLKQLEHLAAAGAELSSIDSYIAARASFKLSPEAIIKLPKHGDAKEVLRESMALNVSRLLGLDTTLSSMMTHNGQPALFVPFQKINELKDYATGETLFAAFTRKPYQHYSTINPVGSGLEADRFVDDFGPSLGLFYLCSDPDAMGAYNQNKALRDDHSLFIFDQVIKPTQFLKLDSRLNMCPSKTLGSHIRHYQGRNLTLIDDSPLASKFDSLMSLKTKQGLILHYVSDTIVRFDLQIRQLGIQLQAKLPAANKKILEAELKTLVSLKEDAILQKEAIVSRIAEIEKILPKHEPSISNVQLRQALVLEKLMHKPVSFSQDGRPYKNPWTPPHGNPVQSIKNISSSDVLISFKGEMDDNMIRLINQHAGQNVLRQMSSNEVLINNKDLTSLNEWMLHPEDTPWFMPAASYLDVLDLRMITQAYGAKEQEPTLERIICAYKKDIESTEDKLDVINKTESYLKQTLHSAKNIGYERHVLKKFHFDVQQKLQAMIPDGNRPANMSEAFAAAVRLDRMAEFNEVIKAAISKQRFELLTPFFNDCVALAAPGLNHQEAIERSQHLNDSASRMLMSYQKGFDLAPAAVAPLPVVNEDEDKEIDLSEIDPVDLRAEELRAELNLLRSGLAKKQEDVLVEDAAAAPVVIKASGF